MRHLALTLALLTGLPAGAAAQEASSITPQAVVTSTQRLTFDLTEAGPLLTARAGQELLIARTVTGQVVPGSSRLNGEPVADPRRGRSGVLYWTLPLDRLTAGPGELSFEVSHAGLQAGATLPDGGAPAISLLTPQGVKRLSGNLDAGDYALATAQPDDKKENAGLIKRPLNGTQLRRTSQFTVVIETEPSDTRLPTVNGVPISPEQLGSILPTPEGRERRSYYAIPAQVGKNVVRFGDDEAVLAYAGPTERYDVSVLDAVADGSTPVRVRIRALDAQGLLTEQPTVTLRSNLEPLRPDARPGELGYQLELVDGEGLLELRPQVTPTPLRLELLRDQEVKVVQLDVRPGQAAFGVGLVSATLGLGERTRFGVQAKAYAETPLAGGQLYLSADSNGLPRGRDVEAGNVTYGDSSSETVPLTGQGPVAFLYEHPRVRVAYRDEKPPVTVVPLPGSMTALSAATKGNVRLSGFASLQRGERRTDVILQPDGTRLLRIGSEGVVPGSESLVVVTRDHQTQVELSRRPLGRNTDYVVDYETGIVTLAEALSPVNAELQNVEVLASYRMVSGQATQLAYGAQVEAGDERSRIGAAAVQMDGEWTYGLSGALQRERLKASGRVLVSGGVQAEASLEAQPRKDDQLSFQVRYQDEGYRGLNKGTPEFRVGVRYQLGLTERLGAVIDGSYRRGVTEQGDVGGLLTYRFKPWTVGAGLRWSFGERSGLSASGLLGYEGDRWQLSLNHAQPLTGNVLPVSDFRVAYRVAPNATLVFKDKFTWGEGHAAALELASTLGKTNYIVAYELPGADGAGNRARFGVSTSLPLSKATTLGLRGSAAYDLNRHATELSGGADLRYQAERYVATLGTDLTWQAGKVGAVVRGGVSGDLSDHLNVSADATAELGARQGMKFGVGYAYRGPALTSLGYLRYRQGSLGGSRPEMTGGLSFDYRVRSVTVRGGVDSRMLLLDRASLTYQPYLGVRAEVTPALSLGAWSRALIQPATQQTLYSYGLEGGVRVLPDTWLTAGYNFRGFAGLPTAGMYTDPGWYLRLDLSLHERR